MQFSIIICTYDCAERLSNTLDSILTQSNDDFEVAIVDGASNDGTLDVIRKYNKRFVGKLRWISEKDAGIYEAMNKGVKMAQGEFLNIIGAGDWLESDALEKAARCISENPQIDAVYGKTLVWDADLKNKYLVQTGSEELPDHPIQHPALFYKKSLHDEFGMYDEKYRIVADYAFCLKAFYNGGAEIVPFDAVVSNFVMDGASSRNGFKVLLENMRARRECGLKTNLTREVRMYLKNLLKNLDSRFHGNDTKNMTNKDIDVFVISYNRLSYLKRLVEWLEKDGFEKIHIVDNASTYPPLLEYLSASRHQVYRMDRNYGHLVVWQSGRFREIIENKNYIVTDCDVLPVEECPLDVVEYFSGILEKYPKFTKVGFGLKIDDLPECYAQKKEVIDWEKQFWENKLEDGLYESSIDTTFALYRPGIYPDQKRWWKSIRTEFPYIARHLPWHEDSTRLSEEDLFYQRDMHRDSSFWSVTDLELLKKYHRQLAGELKEVYASWQWKVLQLVYKICRLFFPGKRFSGKIGRKKIQSVNDISDIPVLQKMNRELFVELGSIRSSSGWKIINFISRNKKDNR